MFLQDPNESYGIDGCDSPVAGIYINDVQLQPYKLTWLYLGIH